MQDVNAQEVLARSIIDRTKDMDIDDVRSLTAAMLSLCGWSPASFEIGFPGLVSDDLAPKDI